MKLVQLAEQGKARVSRRAFEYWKVIKGKEIPQQEFLYNPLKVVSGESASMEEIEDALSIARKGLEERAEAAEGLPGDLGVLVAGCLRSTAEELNTDNVFNRARQNAAMREAILAKWGVEYPTAEEMLEAGIEKPERSTEATTGPASEVDW